MNPTRLPILAIAMLALTAAAACKQQQPLDPALEKAMKERHDGFEAMGDSFKKIMDTLKGGGALNAELAAEARKINAAAPRLADWFPAGSGPESGRKTEAKAEIWQKPEAFTEKREAFVAEAGKLAALADANDAAGFAEQVKAVGNTCKGCHDDFRTEDEH